LATGFDLVALLLIAALIGCDSRSSQTTTGGTTQPSAAKPIESLRLGYFANATHAQAVLGVESGDFAAAISPAKLDTRIFNAGPSLIEALFAGEVDIGYIGPGPTLSAHEKSRGQGVRIIAGAAANGVAIVARKGSGITSMQDLVGKKVATPQQGNTQDIAAKRYMKEVLKQDNFNNVLPVPNAEQAGMMARGQIDAAWAPEPWGARLVAEAEGTIIAEEKDLWPNKEFSLTVVITTPEFLRDHPDVVEKVLKVHCQWTAKLVADPKSTEQQLGDAIFKLTQKRLPEGVLAAALPRVKFTNDPLEDTFKTMGQWANDLGVAQRPPNLTNLFDLKILRTLEPAKAP
jgi:NitT/TauT family transport system substrate-binding protein